jgi:glycosyltransferase involved in cell wall biosynthesis
MKIVYYTDQIYLHGGIERVLANKVNYWVNNKGFETHIITSEQKGNAPCYPIDKKVQMHDLGINYHRNKSYLHFKNIIKTFRHFFVLRRKIKELNPDVVVVCNFAFDFYFMPFIAPKVMKIKEFHSSRVFEHEQRIHNSSILKKIYNKINDYIEAKYHYLVLLTHDERQYYKSNNTVVIPNALSSYPKQQAALINKKVISAGRIAKVKAFDKLIASWTIVASKHPDWSLEIYGDGKVDFVDGLQKQISDLGLDQQLILCGPTQNMEAKMLDASIYALSSLTECFPMVLLEALSCGLPVVSFDCPNGPRNIVNNEEDGLLIPHNNVEKLAEGLIRLIENKSLRQEMGEKARHNIKRLLPEEVMQQWLSLMQAENINANKTSI